MNFLKVVPIKISESESLRSFVLSFPFLVPKNVKFVLTQLKDSNNDFSKSPCGNEVIYLNHTDSLWNFFYRFNIYVQK